MCMRGPIQAYLGHKVRTTKEIKEYFLPKKKIKNKRILLQLGNIMGGYLFLLFLRLRGCMEDYK